MEFSIKINEEKLQELIDEIVKKIKSGELQIAEGPAGEWIPCSEAHPVSEGTYLVTYKDMTIGFACWEHEGPYGPSLGESFWNVIGCQEIVAWMPLPKPYKDPLDHSFEDVQCKAEKCGPEGCKHCEGYEPIEFGGDKE